MKNKIPDNAFEQLIAMGAGGSYSRLAKQLGVSKQAVTQKASREGWSSMRREINARRRAKAMDTAAQHLHEMDVRHLEVAQGLQKLAFHSLRQTGVLSAANSLRAIAHGVQMESRIRHEQMEALHDGRLPADGTMQMSAANQEAPRQLPVKAVHPELCAGPAPLEPRSAASPSSPAAPHPASISPGSIKRVIPREPLLDSTPPSAVEVPGATVQLAPRPKPLVREPLQLPTAAQGLLRPTPLRRITMFASSSGNRACSTSGSARPT